MFDFDEFETYKDGIEAHRCKACGSLVRLPDGAETTDVAVKDLASILTELKRLRSVMELLGVEFLDDDPFVGLLTRVAQTLGVSAI